MAKALTKTDANPPFYGFLPGVSNIWKTMVTLVRAFGGELLNEDGTRIPNEQSVGDYDCYLAL